MKSSIAKITSLIATFLLFVNTAVAVHPCDFNSDTQFNTGDFVEAMQLGIELTTDRLIACFTAGSYGYYPSVRERLIFTAFSRILTGETEFAYDDLIGTTDLLEELGISANALAPLAAISLPDDWTRHEGNAEVEFVNGTTTIAPTNGYESPDGSKIVIVIKYPGGRIAHHTLVFHNGDKTIGTYCLVAYDKDMNRIAESQKCYSNYSGTQEDSDAFNNRKKYITDVIEQLKKETKSLP